MGKVIIAGTIRLPPQNLGRARPIMEAVLSASRAEDGCIEYSYAQDVLDPGLIRIFEIWRDQAALDAHLQAEHLRVWRSHWEDLGIHDRKLRPYVLADRPAP